MRGKKKGEKGRKRKEREGGKRKDPPTLRLLSKRLARIKRFKRSAFAKAAEPGTAGNAAEAPIALEVARLKCNRQGGRIVHDDLRQHDARKKKKGEREG